MTRYIFVTGGVLSSLGKGLAAASLGALLQARGYQVRLRKFEPYLNVDPGTMSPYQHGEVYVTDDGAETDLDLGHYERFTGVSSSYVDAVSTGKIYQDVIARERRGDYLGATIQVIPHITDAIQESILKDVSPETDFLICEIGGTVGDIESLPFLEAIRQFSNTSGRDRTLFLHVTLIPYMASAGELKTKPSQHSVKELQHVGIQPHILLCRSEHPIPKDARDKLALFCNIKPECVIPALDVETIYDVPLSYSKAGLDHQVCTHFGLLHDPKPDLSPWEKVVNTVKNGQKEVTIAVVGKYVGLKDAYKSLQEALVHGGLRQGLRVRIQWIQSEDMNEDRVQETFKGIHGILVPGGYGRRGIDGKLAAITHARTQNIPFLGICYGMQLAVIEFARNVLGLSKASSTEIDPSCLPFVGLLTEWAKDGQIETRSKDGEMGGTMRLGSYPCVLRDDSLAQKAYGKEKIFERHRHRYEVNMSYGDALEKAGMAVSGMSPDGLLPEIIELKDHPWFVGTQFHPEFLSRPLDPHPLFEAFIESALHFKEKNDDF
jgi:CTP synthase